jgi:tetratricopeptide (TPR) repeat protein
LLATLTRDRDELGVLSLGQPPSNHALAIAAFNILQAGRLKTFLRHRPPDAAIGGSILVFRLDTAEIDRALHGPPAELDEQSWFERERYGTAEELVRQGRRHLEVDRLEEALAVFQSATRLYPGDPRAWDGLAIAARELGDNERAAAAERRCNRLRARLIAEEGNTDAAANLQRLGAGNR